MYNTNGDLFRDGWGVRSAGGNISSPSLLLLVFPGEWDERGKNTRRQPGNPLTVVMIHQQNRCSHIKLPFVVVFVVRRRSMYLVLKDDCKRAPLLFH